MTRTHSVFLTLFFLLCLALGVLGNAGHSYALSVNDVRFGVHPEKTRLVFDLSETSDFRVFALSNPYRLVIDLPNFKWEAGSVERYEDSGVTGLRHGELKPGVSRIVFDMRQPVSVRTAFALPQQEERPPRLVIDYSPVSDSGFRQTKDKVFGALAVETALNDSPPLEEPVAIQPYKVASLSSVAPPIPQRKAQQGSKKSAKPLVVIDPGHGGVDPGAKGANGVYEKKVVLALAKELKSQLEATGEYRVMMTRTTDTFIKLGDRVKFARTHGADLFVSIHADSVDKPGVQGASFYTLSEKASDAQTEALAARENRADLIAGIDLSTEDEEVASILVDLAMRDTTNQGKFFANKVVDAFKSGGIKVLENPHRHAGFAVLKAPDIPSILVEAGFMSNKTEASRLNTPEYRSKVAKSLKNGIDAYFAQVRKSNRS